MSITYNQALNEQQLLHIEGLISKLEEQMRTLKLERDIILAKIELEKKVIELENIKKPR